MRGFGQEGGHKGRPYEARVRVFVGALLVGAHGQAK